MQMYKKNVYKAEKRENIQKIVTNILSDSKH